MTCRREPGPDTQVQWVQAPSACRKWRRWPSELPGPANDNATHAPPGAIHAAGLAILGCIVLLCLLVALLS
ncbi:hypothetical protein FV241_17265 [Methylobacterium sp. WL2]|nr:hypothetical protein FVA80_09640 [Methylobacterium sp. WL1]TXN56043.1 hypothetical protein FV241_17265 [Methylobacterium sp. WL2]